MRPLRVKIVCYTNKKHLRDLDKVFTKAFDKDYFNSLGVDFYSFTYDLYLNKRTKMPTQVYVWAVNMKQGEIEFLRGIMKGSRGLALIIDLHNENYKHDLEWFLEKIIGNLEKVIPFLILVKVDTHLIEKIREKIFELVEKQFEIFRLSDYPFWVDFYTSDDLTGIIQGFESLLILITKILIKKKETKDN